MAKLSRLSCCRVDLLAKQSTGQRPRAVGESDILTSEHEPNFDATRSL